MNIRQRCRWLGVVGAGAVIALMTACAPGAATPGSSNEQDDLGLEARDSEHLPDNWDEIVAAAVEEGEVIVYTNQVEDLSRLVVEAFEAQFPGIEVQEVRDASTSLAVRYEQEYLAAGTSPADVLESSTFEPVVATHPDWFIDIYSAPDFLPTLQDYLPGAISENRSRSVVSNAYPLTIAYNTDKLIAADVPQTWRDIADPKWSGRTLWADPEASGQKMSVMIALLDEYGPEYLEDLVTNGLVRDGSSASITQQVAAGAYDLGIGVSESHSADIRAANGPIAHFAPIDPFLVGSTTISLPADGPHPNAARVWATFLLSAQVQEIACSEASLASLNSKAEGECKNIALPKEFVVLPAVADADGAKRVRALLGTQ